jgi:hypothetical protein
MEHMLQVNPSAKPKKQMIRKMFDDKVAAPKSEVQRLLVNVVMVKKKWQMENVYRLY